MLESDTSLSTDMAVATAKKFLRTMSQPFSGKDQDGVSSWSIEDLERHKEKIEEENIRELRSVGLGDGANNGNGTHVEDEYGEDIDAEIMSLVDAQMDDV